jgi:integrase
MQSPDSLNVHCPKCGSEKLWRDGLRSPMFGNPIQRWLCRGCGYRFSDPDDLQKAKEAIKSVEMIETKSLKSEDVIVTNCQICVKETKNLVAEQQTTEVLRRKTTEDIKGKLVQFAWTMQQEGYAQETIRMSSSCLRALITRDADLLEPTSVKDALAKEKKWSQSRRRNVINAYTLFLKFQGLTWEKPICNVTRKFPFIPTEQEIDDLIAGCSNQVATFLQLLKETAMRSGEAKRIQWTDVDFDRRVLVLNEPEKNSLPRIWNPSPKLLNMLNALPRKSERIFGDGPINSMKTTFLKARRRLALKLQNPRLLQIHFHTLRHWKATMEYHRTKDILHTMTFLGHKKVENTLLYVQLDEKLFKEWNDNFITRVAHNVQEACALVETGFEYITGDYNDGGKIFRKRN